MTKTKLTAAAVEKIKPDPHKRREIADGLLAGFYLVVQPSGAKSWAVRYRHGGKTRKHTIGTYPAFGLGKARASAEEALRSVAQGIDPATERAAVKAESRRKPDTVRAVVEEFIERYAKRKNRSWQETERVLEKEVLSHWGDRDLSSITRRDVLELLDGIMDRGAPYLANRVLAAVRKLFNWAVERGIVEATPAAKIKAPAKETERDRVLNDDEVRSLWSAWSEQDWPFGPLFKLLLVTAQRRDEVANMRWCDLDRDNRVWILPRELTKSDRSHEVPLSPLALEIINSLPEAGDFVFPSRAGRDRPVSGFSKAKARTEQMVTKRTEKEDGTIKASDWRLHDLRRTAGTNMARLGITVDVIGRVLNHSSGRGVTGIYDRHSYLPEKRRALDAWAAKLESIVSRDGANKNVVPIHG